MEQKLSNSKILIIDDIPDNIALLSGILDFNNFETFVAQSGKKALNILDHILPDLILLDIMMPEMDGFELCAILKNNPKTQNIPIIFITARNDLETIARGFEAGVVDYIVKPVQALELIKRVTNHLKLKFSQEELINNNKNLEELVLQRTKKLQKEIEERKKGEIILKQSEEKFKYLFNNNYDGILISTLDGDIIEANETFCKMMCTNKYKKNKLKDILCQQFGIRIEKKYQQIVDSSCFTTEVLHSKNKKMTFELKSKRIFLNQKEALIIFFHEITHQKENERKILKTIIETEEKERKRFARDIHDGLGALLSSANMYLELLEQKEIGDERKSKILKDISELLCLAISSARNIANNIKPHLLSNYGMEEALKSIFEKITNSSNIKIDFLYNLNNSKLSENTEVTLFRITNELITNTIKYADANQISVIFKEENNKVTLAYSDDGKGFEVKDAMKKDDSSMGLQNIISRVKSIHGKCSIESKPGKGCAINVSVNV